MSHIVQIQTEVRDPLAVQAACSRLGLPQPIQQIAKLFSGDATGLTIHLPGWQYPIVCDLTQGQMQFDNYGGVWGDQAQLDRFLQAYAAEKTKLEARRQGHNVTEQVLADGSLKLTIQVSGGTA